MVRCGGNCRISVEFGLSLRGWLVMIVAWFIVRLRGYTFVTGASRGRRLVNGIVLLLCNEFVVIEVYASIG